MRLAGDFTGWQPRGAILQDVGENLKAAAMEFPATARVEYKLIVDGEWIADPLNPNKLDNGVGSENSVVHNARNTNRRIGTKVMTVF